jgi:hypothetical protein
MALGFIPGTPADWPDGGFGKYPEAKAPLDENGNGIPDKWEIGQGLDLEETKATGRDLGSKYNNIEVYMNSLLIYLTRESNKYYKTSRNNFINPGLKRMAFKSWEPLLIIRTMTG